jgi:hypothetical protein
LEGSREDWSSKEQRCEGFLTSLTPQMN